MSNLSPASAPSLEERLTILLRPQLRLLPAGAPLPLDADLGRLGLDSLQSIDLLIAMEQEFGVQIPDERITVESFSTPQHLLALLTPQP